MIELKSVTKHYASARALLDVSLSVSRGTSLALVGSSGSGKSTVMRLLTGLTTAERGEVVVADVVVAKETLREVRERVGYVIQEGGLFPHLTCKENVTLLARRRGVPGDKIRTRTEELAELVRLPASLIERRPSEVSGGQRQRVALMRALFRDPDVLLLDEPFGALDPVVRLELGDELFALLRKLGKTVLMVTHDLAEAAATTDVLALLHEGRLLQKGTLSELRAEPVAPFVTKFLSAHRSLEGVA